MHAQIQSLSICSHCGDAALFEPVFSNNSEEIFCCAGCKLVYQCIQSGGLQNFYDILDSEGKSLPKVNSVNKEYEFLKEEDFLKDFGNGKDLDQFSFYIQGIECMACSWIFSNLSSVNENIKTAEFKIETNILEIKMFENKKLYEVILFVASLGYKLIPLKNTLEAEAIYEAEKKSDLIRIGITGALWMNIMIFSISLYSGAFGNIADYFKTILSLLFIPIITYSAMPFYKNVFAGLKRFRPTIDLPIVMSIIFGAVLSYRSFYLGNEKIYFDSISMFLFFILSTRYFLAYLFKKEVDASIFESIYGEQQILLFENDIKKYLHISQVKQGDHILVGKGEIVPLSGEILNTHSHFNESLITGESDPVLREVGSLIKSGSKNLSNDIVLEVNSKDGANSFHDFLDVLNISSSRLFKYERFGSAYSLILSISLILISVFFFLNYPINTAFERVLALMIICCPCALGMGIPLASILKVKKLARKGIAVRDNSIFEKFQSVTTLCFDKTGTLTNGKFKINKIVGNDEYISHLVALERLAEHPIAIFLCKEFKEFDRNLNVENWCEVPGKGVSGKINNVFCEIKGSPNGSIILNINDKIVLEIYYSEIVSSENVRILKKLSNKYKIEIISGDNEKNVEKFSEYFGDNPKMNYYHSYTPKQKKDHLSLKENTIYIGDGLNDVMAMKESSISISLNVSKLVDDVCSVVFMGGDLKKIAFFFKEVQNLDTAIKKIIGISIMYNIIGFTLVLYGLTGPLLAAVLMPLSSLFVVLYTFLQSKESI